MKGWESDEVSEGKNKSSLVEIVPNNSSVSELPVKREENGNLLAIDNEKGQISAIFDLVYDSLNFGSEKF